MKSVSMMMLVSCSPYTTSHVDVNVN